MRKDDKELIGGGTITLGEITDVGNGYRVPTFEEFVDGFEYERTDGRDWYKKVYRSYMRYKDDNDKVGHLVEYDRGDVLLLIPQSRVRVKVG